MGDAQGGRSGENPRMDDSVIQGNYRQYAVDDLYGTNYRFSQWESDCTANLS